MRSQLVPLSLIPLLAIPVACSRRHASGLRPTSTQDTSTIGSTLMNSDSLGQLKLGLSEPVVMSLLSDTPQKGSPELWAADGQYHQAWDYPKLGLKLDFCSDAENGPRKLAAMTATAPCTLRTARMIRIGSTEDEARRAYAAEFNKEESSPGKVIVAGSTYGGISFRIRNHRITQIFIGAASE